MSKTYLVGGAVRDRIMGKEPKDMDWVIVGETVENMDKTGYMRVGEHFPVYLLPNGDELAMARTERSTGTGYNDFEVDFNPNVTIEEDLYRRDLTINAIAFDESTNSYVDPHGGVQDVLSGTIRMVNPNAFRDDPLRVFRAIRFAGRYGFTMEPKTRDMVIYMVKAGALGLVSKERVFVEFMKCIDDMGMNKFIDILYDLDVLEEFGFDKKFIDSHSFQLYDDEGCLASHICFYCENMDAFMKVYETLHLTKIVHTGASIYFAGMDATKFEILELVGAGHDTHKLKYAMDFGYVFPNMVEVYRSVTAEQFPDLQGKELGIAIKNRRKELIDAI